MLLSKCINYDNTNTEYILNIYIFFTPIDKHIGVYIRLLEYIFILTFCL